MNATKNNQITLKTLLSSFKRSKLKNHTSTLLLPFSEVLILPKVLRLYTFTTGWKDHYGTIWFGTIIWNYLLLSNNGSSLYGT